MAAARATRAAAVVSRSLKIVECPRDAMQGLKTFIPTGQKQRYINALLRCGFHTVDFGSFVSPAAVPQMRDTPEVLRGLTLEGSPTQLLAVVVNERGCRQACGFQQVAYVGFPLSLNETFQRRNTNKTTAEALEEVRRMQELCVASNKTLVVYLSMAFGNPYGDPYDPEAVDRFVHELDGLGVQIVSLADTTGCSHPALITALFEALIPRYPRVEFGAHFHSSPTRAMEKITAAYDAGVRRFDGALGGMGGCPYAADALTGNVATETLLAFCDTRGLPTGVDRRSLQHAEDIRVLSFAAPMRELVIATALGDEQQLERMCRAHFDAADLSHTGALSWEDFQRAMRDAYAELGEPSPSEDKLRAMFERNARKDRIHFEEYLEGARRGLQKRLRTTG